jgi:endonuclease/exonuclease/phosphatase family metal-dependent hydrolase
MINKISTSLSTKFQVIMKIITAICLFSLLMSYFAPYIHPETFWLMPFFGLAYPIVLIFSLFLLLFWIVLKSKWTFIVLFFILIGGKLHFRTVTFSVFQKPIPESSNSFKIMSYNVQLFGRYSWVENEVPIERNEIFKYLQEEDPDVICFQEFFQQDKPSKFLTKDTLTKILGTKYIHERYTHKEKERQNFGIAMFSKYEMISKGDIIFEDLDKKNNNYCIYADIVKEKDTFRIYNAHFQSVRLQLEDYKLFGETDSIFVGHNKSNTKKLIKKLNYAFKKRADQALIVKKHMNLSPYPVILCGDFNDTPMSYSYNCFYGNYIDAFRKSGSGIGRTFAGKVPAGRIDYIFHSKDLNSSNFKIQKEVHSDHLAISCEIWKNKKNMIKRNNSEELFETAKKYFPGGVNSPVRAFKSVGGTPYL